MEKLLNEAPRLQDVHAEPQPAPIGHNSGTDQDTNTVPFGPASKAGLRNRSGVQPGWMSVRETSAYFGMSPNTLRKFVKEHGIRGRRISKRLVLLPIAEIDAAIRSESEVTFDKAAA